MNSLSGTAKRTGRWLRARWHAIRHPAGWYDEIDALYGTKTRPSGRASSGAAGIGGMIGGGGGV